MNDPDALAPRPAADPFRHESDVFVVINSDPSAWGLPMSGGDCGEATARLVEARFPVAARSSIRGDMLGGALVTVRSDDIEIALSMEPDILNLCKFGPSDAGMTTRHGNG
jgi:hypothetical protein